MRCGRLNPHHNPTHPPRRAAGERRLTAATCPRRPLSAAAAAAAAASSSRPPQSDVHLHFFRVRDRRDGLHRPDGHRVLPCRPDGDPPRQPPAPPPAPPPRAPAGPGDRPGLFHATASLAHQRGGWLQQLLRCAPLPPAPLAGGKPRLRLLRAPANCVPHNKQILSFGLMASMGFNSSKYYHKANHVWTSQLTGGALSFILFWTLMYDICHQFG